MCGKVSQENSVELTAASLYRIAKNGEKRLSSVRLSNNFYVDIIL